eukprot:UN00095
MTIKMVDSENFEAEVAVFESLLESHCDFRRRDEENPELNESALVISPGPIPESRVAKYGNHLAAYIERATEIVVSGIGATSRASSKQIKRNKIRKKKIKQMKSRRKYQTKT